jgi:hypothetical protein
VQASGMGMAGECAFARAEQTPTASSAGEGGPLFYSKLPMLLHLAQCGLLYAWRRLSAVACALKSCFPCSGSDIKR